MTKIHHLSYIACTCLLFFTGCAQKADNSIFITNPSADKEVQRFHDKVYQMGIKPIVSSRNDNARVIVDTGVVLDIYITPYRDDSGNLIGGHDKYVWVRKPDFIVGMPQPPHISNTRGLLNGAGGVPFSLRPSEIDMSAPLTNDVLKKVANHEYETTASQTADKTRTTPYDESIKDFLKQNKQ